MVTSIPPRRADNSHDELVAEHLECARSLAHRLRARLPACVDWEDLESDAYLGLLKAARTFDPARGVMFRTYAARRIYGQMLDGLRERNQVRRNHPAPQIQSLDAPGGDGPSLADELIADQPPVGEALEMLEEAELVLKRLSPQDRRYLIDHYLGGKPQKQIAREEGVSASMISLRFKAIGRRITRMREE